MNVHRFETIRIEDDEIPVKIRGSSQGLLVLYNGNVVKLEGLSDAALDVIQAAVTGTGAVTKKDLQRVLNKLAAEI